MRASAVILEVLGLLCRYAVAMLVTLSVWALVTLLGARAINRGFLEFLSGAQNHPMHYIGCLCVAYTAAFAGVLLGSLCFVVHSRRLAGAVLLILGLAYYLTFWYVSWRHQMPSKHGNDPRLLELVAGGLCALWAIVLSSRRPNAGDQEAGEVRSPRALLASYWWRCFLVGMSGLLVAFWVLNYL